MRGYVNQPAPWTTPQLLAYVAETEHLPNRSDDKDGGRSLGEIVAVRYDSRPPALPVQGMRFQEKVIQRGK